MTKYFLQLKNTFVACMVSQILIRLIKRVLGILSIRKKYWIMMTCFDCQQKVSTDQQCHLAKPNCGNIFLEHAISHIFGPTHIVKFHLRFVLKIMGGSNEKTNMYSNGSKARNSHPKFPNLPSTWLNMKLKVYYLFTFYILIKFTSFMIHSFISVNSTYRRRWVTSKELGNLFFEWRGQRTRWNRICWFWAFVKWFICFVFLPILYKYFHYDVIL